MTDQKKSYISENPVLNQVLLVLGEWSPAFPSERRREFFYAGVSAQPVQKTPEAIQRTFWLSVPYRVGRDETGKEKIYAALPETAADSEKLKLAWRWERVKGEVVATHCLAIHLAAQELRRRGELNDLTDRIENTSINPSYLPQAMPAADGGDPLRVFSLSGYILRTKKSQ